MIILALDLGTATGWALSGDPRLYGRLDLKGGRYEGGGMRFLRFRRWLEEVLGGVECVVFEEVRSHGSEGRQNTDAAHIYGGLLAILTSECEKREVPFQGVPVGTIKKFATGMGNAGKPHMIAAANATGCKTTDDNVADAWCLLGWAEHEFK